MALLSDNVLANAITSHSTEKHVLEGEKTTLSCNYSGSSINSFQWYRQFSSTAPEFILQAFESLGPQKKDQYIAKVRKDQKQLDLEISKTETADSAIYYCALVPTVTGNLSTLKFICKPNTTINLRKACFQSVDVNNLQWSRQYPGSRPEHLILITEYSDPPDPSLRLSAKATKDIKRVDLKISSAEVSDSAVYYCALQPTYSGLGPSFQWYRQYPGSRPEFLIFQTETSVSSEPTLRLTAIPKKEMTQVDLEISSAEVSDSAVYYSKDSKDKKQVNLTISSAEVSDSALYYCALRPTVTESPETLSHVHKELKSSIMEDQILPQGGAPDLNQ
ncbi:hypothetical protein F2P79_019560 [Pimephales promelas]|nr:hypothetical protein F2P79_019560 [Pimephales promelas]